MAKKKVKLSKKESEDLMPVIREFNKLAKSLTGMLGKRVKAKERKINIMVSRIKRPDENSHHIKVKSVEFSSGFLKRQKKKKDKKSGSQSEWDDGFSSKRGFVI